MAVDSTTSNRASNEEINQRTREAYNNRESEETKKHKQEIKRLTEAHNRDIQKLEDEHTKNLNELKEKSKELITSHDMKYQKDIDDLREMHQKQLSRNFQDNDSKMRQAEDSYSGENQKIKQISEKQRETLVKNYESDLHDKDEKLSQVGNENKEKMHETSEGIKKRYTEQYEKDLKLVNDDRERKSETDREQFENLRKAKDGQLHQLGKAKEIERNRLIKNFESNLGQEKEDRGSAEVAIKEQFDEAIKKDQNKYKKALDQRMSATENSRDGLDAKVADRIDNEVRALKVENDKIKADGRRDLISADRHKKIEMGNLSEEFQKNVDVAETNRLMVVDETNRSTHHQFDEIAKKNSETLYSTNKFYKETMGLDKARNRENEVNKQSEFDSEITHSAAQNSVRFNKFKSLNEAEQQRLKENYDQSSHTMHENFDDRLDSVRIRNKEDQDKLFSTFNKQAHENDRQFQDKLAETTIKYENEIAKMNDQHLKEMKELKAEGDRRLKAQTKLDQVEIDKQKSQLDYRMAKIEESHKKDISDINRRHEQTLADLSKLKGASNPKT